MTFHYGQRVEVWTEQGWQTGTLEAPYSDGSIRIKLDAGHYVALDAFYIRPLEES